MHIAHPSDDKQSLIHKMLGTADHIHLLIYKSIHEVSSLLDLYHLTCDLWPCLSSDESTTADSGDVHHHAGEPLVVPSTVRGFSTRGLQGQREHLHDHRA